MPQLFYHYTSAGALVNKHYALCHRWATNTTGNDCRHRSGAGTSQVAQPTSQVFQLNATSQAVQLGNWVNWALIRLPNQLYRVSWRI